MAWSKRSSFMAQESVVIERSSAGRFCHMFTGSSRFAQFPAGCRHYSIRAVPTPLTRLRMRIGVPKEIKNHEYRVGLVPAGVRELVAAGHEVLVQSTAGAGIGVDDAAYVAAGAKIVATAKEVFDGADLVVKVKEPQLAECKMLRPRPDPVHLSASRRRCRAGEGADGVRRDRDRVRNGHCARRLAAAADADERSRGPHVGAGRRRFAAEGEWRYRCVARRRAGRAAGEGRDPRRRCLRHAAPRKSLSACAPM